MRHLAASLLVLVTTLSEAPSPAGPAAAPGSSQTDRGAQGVVILVRHAERADAGMASAKMTGADPDLSPAGRARAEALAALLKDAGITSIFTSEYKRTRQTAQPVAAAIAINPVAVDANDAAGLIGKVKAADGNVLVIGHSNTLPDVLKGLGITETVAIADDQFDNVFIVIRGPQPRLLRLHF